MVHRPGHQHKNCKIFSSQAIHQSTSQTRNFVDRGQNAFEKAEDGIEKLFRLYFSNRLYLLFIIRALRMKSKIGKNRRSSVKANKDEQI